MNGFLLLIPFLLIRFALLGFMNQDAVQRAAHFAPMRGRETIAYWVYQTANIVMFVYLLFLKIKTDSGLWLGLGLSCYLAGLALCAAYFICFVGMAALTRSWILLGIILVFQISAHWIILAEERECIERFGASYEEYMKKVRRYI
ncbi:MAG: phospholipid methyltransferase [Lachnospiraceae bacterium]|nr:phospholipid methyltransferase [Lachnospiraceae bacterium]